MKNILLSLLFPTLIFGQGQEKTANINPEKNWYFGAEIGTNKITSYQIGDANTTFQGGVLAEYYCSRHWSLSGRIKYFETGVSFYKPNTHSGSWFDLGSDEYFGDFKGAVISVPIDIKWEFRLYRNLSANIKLGFAYNFETKSTYGNYSSNLSTDYSKQYSSFDSSYGLNYFINKKTAVYFEIQYYNGASKGHSDGFLSNINYNADNKLLNFGIKYNFKKQSK